MFTCDSVRIVVRPSSDPSTDRALSNIRPYIGQPSIFERQTRQLGVGAVSRRPSAPNFTPRGCAARPGNQLTRPRLPGMPLEDVEGGGASFGPPGRLDGAPAPATPSPTTSSGCCGVVGDIGPTSAALHQPEGEGGRQRVARRGARRDLGCERAAKPPSTAFPPPPVCLSRPSPSRAFDCLPGPASKLLESSIHPVPLSSTDPVTYPTEKIKQA